MKFFNLKNKLKGNVTKTKQDTMVASETANKQYKYNHMFFGKSLEHWVQETQLHQCKNYGWPTNPLKRGGFGFDNLAISVGFLLQSLETNRDLLTNIEQASDIIHQGWTINYTFWRDNQPDKSNKDYKGPAKPLGDERRNMCAKSSYINLPEDEKEKDRVIARFVLQTVEPFLPPLYSNKIQTNEVDMLDQEEEEEEIENVDIRSLINDLSLQIEKKEKQTSITSFFTTNLTTTHTTNLTTTPNITHINEESVNDMKVDEQPLVVSKPTPQYSTEMLQHVVRFIVELKEKKYLPIEKLYDIAREHFKKDFKYIKPSQIQIETVQAPIAEQQEPVRKQSKKEQNKEQLDNNPTTSDTCIYKFTARHKSRPGQICGSKVISGTTLCREHTKVPKTSKLDSINE